MADAKAQRRGWSLGTKLIAGTVLLLATAVGTSAYYSAHELEQLARSQTDARRADGEAAIERYAQTIMRNTGSTAGPTTAGGNLDLLQELLEGTVEASADVAWMALFDELGESEKVAAGTQGAPTHVVKDELYEQLRREPRTSNIVQMRDPKDATTLVFAANVTSGDQVVGRLRMSVSTARLETALEASIEQARAQARRSVRNQLFVAIAILVLAILLAGYQGLRISRPLRELSRQAERIAGGDFEQRVRVKSRDEIGNLATNFNSMAESLGSVLAEMAEKQALEREVQLARDVQEMMSPSPGLHEARGFAITGSCVMAEMCGGDWWTYRELSNGRLLVVVGDVTGHGMPAAMIAATARGAVEALSMVDEDALTPSRLLAAIDEAIRDVGKTQLLMTCFAMLIDPALGHVQFANAGHNFPYVMHMSDSGSYDRIGVLAARGNPLGNPAPCFNSGERQLGVGDVIVLATDGVTERIGNGGERFGDKRFRRLLKKHQPEREGQGVLMLRDVIVNAVNEFGGDVPLDDDLTLVVVEYLGDTEVESRVAS